MKYTIATLALVGHISARTLAQYDAPGYSAKWNGNGKYSPQWVEDFTDSVKFDTGVGGGIDQDNHPYPKGALAQNRYVAPGYSAKWNGNGQYAPVWVEDFTDSVKFDSGVGGGIDQDNHPYPKGALAQNRYDAPGYSAKWNGNGKYSPQWVEDFTDSVKFDTGVGGGIDQDNHPYPKGLLAQGGQHKISHDHLYDFEPYWGQYVPNQVAFPQQGANDVWKPVDVNKKRRIYDADGDGVEDNVHKTADELDRFYKPNRMGPTDEDIYNTKHGDLPGHVRKEEATSPKDEAPLYGKGDLGVINQNGHYYNEKSQWASNEKR